MRNSTFQQCTKTVMDNIADPNITFDENGICNYYYEYFEKEKKHVKKGEEGQQYFKQKISAIKEDGKNKPYDCILGLSGGVDSSYMALLAKKEGLRPLVVHFDNGWNSELAVKNIENIVSILDFDLFTYVINWEEFRDLQRAYLKASVVDIEVLTDHAIKAILTDLAAKHKINYSLSGFNVVTEGILPKAWNFNKTDSVNIKDIHKHFGSVHLKTYPFFSPLKKRYSSMVNRIQTIPLLNSIDYNKDNVKQILIKELDWKDYGGKHYESIFTRFYQGYILPEKFNIDKRKAHLSTLICSKQLTKEDAVNALNKPIYDHKQLITDKEFVLKKLGFSDEEFEEIMNTPQVPHTQYKTEVYSYFDKYPFTKPFREIYNLFKPKK